MAEISNNPEVNKEAWSFYSYEKSESEKLNEAIQHEGQPNYDPNAQGTNS